MHYPKETKVFKLNINHYGDRMERISKGRQDRGYNTI
jgi:hypothetical protein